MPYIPFDRRQQFEEPLKALCDALIANDAQDGDVNYLVTRLVLHHTTHGGQVQPRYADYEAAIGLLECIKLELYRKAVARYEDTAATRNGDVY